MEPDFELRSDVFELRAGVLNHRSTLPGRWASGRQVWLPLLWIVKGVAHIRAFGVLSVQPWGGLHQTSSATATSIPRRGSPGVAESLKMDWGFR